MKLKLLVSLCLIAAMLAMPAVALADAYPNSPPYYPAAMALADGEGSEFVQPVDGLAPDAFASINEAYEFVLNNITYVLDSERFAEQFPGVDDVWVSANQTYYDGVGDCEDKAILLCALLRFHTADPLPADNVWVLCNRGFQHAWVQIKTDRGILTIDPTWDIIKPGGGGQLKFNDQWVKPLSALRRGPPF
jgi:predicted transglutaminase-like cysteine proteinase